MKFSDKCYSILKRVPKGRVVSYKQIAFALGCKGYRAVGQVMKRNKNKDVCCHRVVCSDGGLGGFNRGVREKVRLLEGEGVEVVNGKVDLRRFGWEIK